MALANYADLQAAVASWQARSDLTVTIPDAITLGEARLNRELGEVLTSAALTGVVDSREIDISSLSMAEPIALFMTVTGAVNEKDLLKRARGNFPYSTTSGVPSIWAVAGTKIIMDCPLLGAYSFRFEYRQRFALSDAAPTNWLLTNHPDIYLAASILWSGMFTEDDSRAAKYAGLLEQGIPSVKAYISRQNRSQMTADPGLLAMASRRRTFNINTGQ